MSGSRSGRSIRAGAALFAWLGVVAGCSHAKDFLWVDDVPSSMFAAETTYEVAPGDVIGVRVFNQEANSVERARVREDGKITLPLLGDVEVAGSTPADVARRLEVKLKAFINSPMVTVVLHERRPLRVSVLGQVTRPGVYELDRGGGVLHALAAAGGMTPFASGDRVFVLRSGYWAFTTPEPARIRFRYADLRAGKAPASLFLLKVGDVVVVE
jgi:polysaccharide export outer membrane protein